MNKKLIVLALAALPAAAMADVTLYGTMSGGVEHDAFSSASGLASQNEVSDYTSILGFKGTEDLGNGLKTVWQIENRIFLNGDQNAPGTSTTGFATRQTFVGLDGGNLGQVRMGYLNTALNDQYSVDQWSDGNGVNGLQVFDAGTRLKNAIRYDSATFAGVSAVLGYGFGENATASASASNIVTGGLNYNTPLDGLVVHYAFNHDYNPTQASKSVGASEQLLEADYSQGNLFLSGAYQWATGYDWGNGTAANDPFAANQVKTQQVALSAAYSFGAIKPKISFAKGWDTKTAGVTLDNSGYTQYVAGVDYSLSKRTTVGVAYGHMSQGANFADNTLATSTLSLNLAHNF